MMHHCGGAGGGSSSFSVFLSVPNHGGAPHDIMDTYSNSVDCTLSLATPSARSSEFDSDQRAAPSRHLRRPAASYVSNLCWDLFHPSAASAVSHGGDPLLARRCANCDTTSTPLWRNGPRGPKSLCNACGIRFKKEERRAAAAATVNITAAESTTTWFPPQLTTHKLPYLSPAAAANNGESIIIGNETENGISFLSWRLNVTDHRPSLVQDFTR